MSAALQLSPKSSSGPKKAYFSGTVESKAGILGPWATSLHAVIQRPRPVSAARREWGLEQKAHLPPLTLRWWEPVRWQCPARSPLKNELHQAEKSITQHGICATAEQLDTPGALQEEEQAQGGRWSLVPRCPGLWELEGKQIRRPYLPALRPIPSFLGSGPISTSAYIGRSW